MISNIPLKEFANIGKSILTLSVGICENYKQEIICEEIDYAACSPECPFFNFSIDQKKDYCINHCSAAPKKLPEITYVNEKNKYRLSTIDISEKKRLSKFQLLQFMLYHFLSVDSNGIIKYTSIKEIAKILGCTTKTVRNNNEVLRRMGFVATSTITTDIFNIIILGYKDYRLSQKDGGHGYIPMAQDFFAKLIEIDNVNAIRLCIRELIKADDDEVKLNEKIEESVFTYKNIKHFMPKNISYKSAIEDIVNKTSELFDIEKKASFMSFQLKDEFNGKKLKLIKEEVFKKNLTVFLDDNKIAHTNKDISDLVQLSMEYGFSHVEIAIAEYSSKYIKLLNDGIENLGGFIRELIRKKFFENIAA